MTKWDKNVDHFHILKYLKPIHMKNPQAIQPLCRRRISSLQHFAFRDCKHAQMHKQEKQKRTRECTKTKQSCCNKWFSNKNKIANRAIVALNLPQFVNKQL